MKTIAVFGNRHQEGFIDSIGFFFKSMREAGFRLCINRRFADYLRLEGVSIGDAEIADGFPDDAEMVVSIGGDGTFLRASQWAGRSRTPVLGINTGHLGFLASCTFDDMDALLDAITGGSLRPEPRMLLEVVCDGLPDDVWPFALNEVAVLKSETSSMITVHAEIDGFYLADYLSDGLIVSTPTGSTAYSLSVGGPILEPTLKCMVLSPIASHSLAMRPLVVDGDSKLLLNMTSRSSEFRLSIDGRSVVLPCGREVRIRRAPFETTLLRLPDEDFPSIIRDKLLWGRRQD